MGLDRRCISGDGVVYGRHGLKPVLGNRVRDKQCLNVIVAWVLREL